MCFRRLELSYLQSFYNEQLRSTSRISITSCVLGTSFLLVLWLMSHAAVDCLQPHAERRGCDVTMIAAGAFLHTEWIWICHPTCNRVRAQRRPNRVQHECNVWSGRQHRSDACKPQPETEKSNICARTDAICRPRTLLLAYPPPPLTTRANVSRYF